jgi:hypothetical protein
MIAGCVTVRNLGGIVRYIEWNPVSVGTVERAEMWPWSSASKTVIGRLGLLGTCPTLPFHELGQVGIHRCTQIPF